ncbi:MAG TPA: hypothetical protein PKY12_07210, partial [Catalimonadaceae bacterium]|nr:hypothetical protein [Catalimonadaceae bacterium]
DSKELKGFSKLIFLVFILSCTDQPSLISPIPDVIVNEQLNLNSAEAIPLKVRDGTAIAIKGGIKGIIIYRRSQDNYVAFERKSPYKLEDSCGIINVHSSLLYMLDSCHNCTFNWEGRPIGGPCRDVMKTYSVQFINNFTLSITNP